MATLSETLETFLSDYEITLNENRARISFFLELVREFRELGIPVLPLKGLDLLLRAYPSAGMRPMADIDLLIQKKDTRKVMAFFEAKGFKRKPDEGLTYLHKEKRLNFDIIWEFWYLTPEENNALWNRTVSRTFEETPLRLLHPEDDFIYLVAYTVAHRGVLSETFSRDLDAFLVKENAEIDWPRLIAKIKLLKLQTYFFHALSYALEKEVSGIPQNFLESLRPGNFSGKLMLRFLKKLVTEAPQPQVSYLFTFLGYPGFQGKLKLLREKILPEKWEADIHWGRSSYLLYFFRIIFRPAYLVLRGILSLTHDLFFFTRKRP